MKYLTWIMLTCKRLHTICKIFSWLNFWNWNITFIHELPFYLFLVDCGESNITIGVGDFVNISSPFYPQPYNFDSSCSWKVNVPNGLKVLARIIDFGLVDGADLLVFNGSLYTGYNPPENITSSSETVDVNFYVRYGIPDKGFLIELSAVNVTGKIIIFLKSKIRRITKFNDKCSRVSLNNKCLTLQ